MCCNEIEELKFFFCSEETQSINSYELKVHTMLRDEMCHKKVLSEGKNYIENRYADNQWLGVINQFIFYIHELFAKSTCFGFPISSKGEEYLYGVRKDINERRF